MQRLCLFSLYLLDHSLPNKLRIRFVHQLESQTDYLRTKCKLIGITRNHMKIFRINFESKKNYLFKFSRNENMDTNLRTVFVGFGTVTTFFGFYSSFGSYRIDICRTIFRTVILKVFNGIRSRNVKSRFILLFVPS